MKGVFSVMKAKRSKKEQVQKASLDSVDWFLAIDGCLARWGCMVWCVGGDSWKGY